MNDIEQEFKWQANTPRAFMRMLCAVQRAGYELNEPCTLHITDVYLADSAGMLEKQKIALRVRCTDGRWEATYKTKTELVDGKAVRREKTLPLPEVNTLRRALTALALKESWDGLPLTNLQPLFRIKNKRRTYLIHPQKGVVAELAFDDCRLSVCGRTLLMKEIELELKSGSAAAFNAVANRLTQESGLSPARTSKVKTALLLRAALEEK